MIFSLVYLQRGNEQYLVEVTRISYRAGVTRVTVTCKNMVENDQVALVSARLSATTLLSVVWP